MVSEELSEEVTFKLNPEKWGASLVKSEEGGEIFQRPELGKNLEYSKTERKSVSAGERS